MFAWKGETLEEYWWFGKGILGVSEETTTGVHRLYQLERRSALPAPSASGRTVRAVENQTSSILGAI